MTLTLVFMCAIFMSFTVSAASTIKLNSTAKTLYKGQSYTLKVLGTKKKTQWKSSNSKIAKVSAAGKVTAKKAGSVTITAKVSGRTLRARITVKNPTIKLNKSSVTIYTSGTTSLQLKATVKGASSKISWSSSNKKIATVNSKGKVVAQKAGTATITAKANGKMAKCRVTVKKKEQSPRLSKENQHKLYQNTIKNYDRKMKQGAAKWGDSGRATYYAFADIDKNGIDELILRYENTEQALHKTNVDSGYGENTYIYTIDNGKVKTVLSSGEYSPWLEHSNFVKVYKNSNLINRGFSHMPADEVFYRYSNGVLSSKSSLSLVGGNVWTINGKKATRQEYINAFNKATNNDTGYPMERYKG